MNFSSGRNEGVSGGTSSTIGNSSNTTDGRSSSFTSGLTTGTSQSDTQGRSSSSSEGASYAETDGTSSTDSASHTASTGTTRTAGTGRGETLHKRPLIQPDEVGRHFARIDDPENLRYPGLALVMIAGHDPLIVRKCNYFEDVQFIGCFSPHPDHEFSIPFGRRLFLSSPDMQELLDIKHTLEAAGNGRQLTIAKWLIEPGQPVRAGDVAAIIERVPPDNRTVRIYTPYSGNVSDTAATDKNRLPSGEYAFPFNDWFSVRNYYENYEPDDALKIDPFRELHEAYNALPLKLRQPAQAPPAAAPPSALEPTQLSGGAIFMLILFVAAMAVLFAIAFAHR